jgi:hypothetical protein
MTGKIAKRKNPTKLIVVIIRFDDISAQFQPASKTFGCYWQCMEVIKHKLMGQISTEILALQTLT